MTSRPSRTPKARNARAAMANRPAGELLFDVRLAPPDGDRGEDGAPLPVDLHVDLREFTLSERQLVKRILAKMAEPPDMDDVIVGHAFVVWRRTHPTASLQNWMDHITWGDLLDGLQMEPGHVAWDTTPKGYDPNL